MCYNTKVAQICNQNPSDTIGIQLIQSIQCLQEKSQTLLSMYLCVCGGVQRGGGDDGVHVGGGEPAVCV